MTTVAVSASLLVAMGSAASSDPIPRQDVLDIQAAWADSIVRVSNIHPESGEYHNASRELIERFYADGFTDIIFKPLSDIERPDTFDHEDAESMLRPWQSVRFGEQQIITSSETAIAMGNYYFTAIGSDEELKFEYTFAYVRDDFGDLRIKLHHASFPYADDEDALTLPPVSVNALAQVLPAV